MKNLILGHFILARCHCSCCSLFEYHKLYFKLTYFTALSCIKKGHILSHHRRIKLESQLSRNPLTKSVKYSGPSTDSYSRNLRQNQSSDNTYNNHYCPIAAQWNYIFVLIFRDLIDNSPDKFWSCNIRSLSDHKKKGSYNKCSPLP